MTETPLTMPESRQPEPDDRPSYLDYTDGELLELAQGNIQAVIAGTIGFLHGAGVDPAAWLSALGDVFALGWDEPEPWTPGEFLDAIVVNLRALGAEIVELDAKAEPVTARTRGFPDAGLCERLGVAVDDVLRYNDTLARVARERGVDWSWRRDGDETVYAAGRAR